MVRRRLNLPGDRGRAAPLTLGVLRGDKGLDESVGALGVEGQGVAQRGQLGALLHKGLLQTVSSGVEVLLQRAGTAKSILFQVRYPGCISINREGREITHNGKVTNASRGLRN